MFGFLKTFIPGGWLLYAVAGLAAGAVGSTVGWQAHRILNAPTISRLETDVAKAKQATADSETRYKSYVAGVERDRADANARAAQQAQAQAAEQERLRAQLASAQRARQRASAALSNALRKADAEGSATQLSPIMLSYVAAIRREQMP